MNGCLIIVLLITRLHFGKLELQTDMNTEVDKNIGGGRANFVSKVIEDVVARWDSDRRL